MELSKTQKRIIEIKKEIADDAGSLMSSAIYGKDRKLAELDALEAEERFQSSQQQLEIIRKQANISLWLGIGSILIGLIAGIAPSLISILLSNQKDSNSFPKVSEINIENKK